MGLFIAGLIELVAIRVAETHHSFHTDGYHLVHGEVTQSSSILLGLTHNAYQRLHQKSQTALVSLQPSSGKISLDQRISEGHLR